MSYIEALGGAAVIVVVAVIFGAFLWWSLEAVLDGSWWERALAVIGWIVVIGTILWAAETWEVMQ